MDCPLNFKLVSLITFIWTARIRSNQGDLGMVINWLESGMSDLYINTIFIAPKSSKVQAQELDCFLILFAFYENFTKA